MVCAKFVGQKSLYGTVVIDIIKSLQMLLMTNYRLAICFAYYNYKYMHVTD
jgi:hypothetical protein